jgi:hypothetical protein
VTAADIPPDRPHLAAMLRVFAHSPGPFGHRARLELLDYLAIAEDTIKAQSAMLTADLTDRGVHLAEIDRLKTENASLRTLAEAALVAGQLNDETAITTIRDALEKTA